MADVNIDVKVDDKGSLNQVGKSAQSARRQVGGVAKTASASGKQFSKMSQGITGGLVPAYAQLAATLFAVDAVFRALKTSSDLRVQREGMMAYAASTGMAMQTVTKSLQKATQAQLSFAEAGQASAIGLAAGLTADQINQIGIAANNASKALGRNFADSFDRVLKGIVKGEPELLDELGIILRLEEATRKYAQANNIARDDLTAFQRSQAVFNEVIGQATDKYAVMAEGVDPSGIQRLATALEDVKNVAMEAFAPIAEFFAGVFTNNMTAAIALLATFAASIINKIIPTLGDLTTSLKATGTSLKGSFSGSLGSLKLGAGELKGAYKTATASPAMLQKRAGAAAAAFGPTKSQTITALANGEKLNARQLASTKRMLKKAEMEYKKHGKITTGYLKGEDIKKVRNLKIAVNQMNSATRNWGRLTLQTAKLAGMGLAHTMKAASIAVVATFKVMGLAAKGFAFVANAAMKAAGFIGMAVMLFQIFKELQKNVDKILKFMGGAFAKIGEIMKGLAEKARAAGMDRIANLAEGLGNKANAAADKFNTMAEAKKDALEDDRKTEAIKDQIDEIGKAARESTAELVQMAAARRAAVGEETTKDKLMIQGGMAQTGGGNIVSNLKGLIGKQGDRSEAVSAIVEQMKAMGIAQYTELGEFLSEAIIDDKSLSYFVDQAEKLNISLRAPKESITAVGEGVKALSKALAESSGNATLAMVKSLRAMNPEFKNLADNTGLLLKDAPELEAYLEQVLGKGRASQVKTVAEAHTILNNELDRYNELLANQRARALGAIDDSITALGSRTAGSVRAKEISHQKKLSDLTRERSGHLDEVTRLTLALQDPNLEQNAIDDLKHQRDMAEKRAEFSGAALEAEKEAHSVMGQMRKSTENHFVNMFESLASGAMSLKDAMKKLLSSVLADLARILAQRAALAALGVIGLADGGIIPMAKGGVIPKYGRGGVASEPTYLVGEGRNHEAVVPLPDNRSIPVKLQGDTGGTNNVTVNVDATGGSTTTSVGDAQARQLGQMVAAAVQAEIIDQKRPGGILSPYGDGDY